MADKTQLNDYLSECRLASQKIFELREWLQEKRARAEIRSTQIDPNGGTKEARRDDFMANYVASYQGIEEQIDSLEHCRNDMFRMIMKVKDHKYISALLAYYMDGLTMEAIADQKQRDRRTIYRWKNEGFNYLAEVVTDEELEEAWKHLQESLTA